MRPVLVLASLACVCTYTPPPSATAARRVRRLAAVSNGDAAVGTFKPEAVSDTFTARDEASPLGPFANNADRAEDPAAVAPSAFEANGGFIDVEAASRHLAAERAKVAVKLKRGEAVVGDYVVHRERGVSQLVGASKLAGTVRLRFQECEVSITREEAERVLTRLKPANPTGAAAAAAAAAAGTPASAGARPVRLSRWSAKAAWKKKQERAQASVQEVATDLLALYAARAAIHRPPCGDDGQATVAFDRCCSFTPTVDQLSCFEDVRNDMVRRVKPMERLIAGDVGFGKTEVAYRAAMRALENGRQVCLLSPTAVLATQHLRTATERFSAAYAEDEASFERAPVVAMLRSKNSKKGKEVLRAMNAGEVDIIVGTHALLSNDVKPPKLGLLIVDEEQRFGVNQKEKIKSLAAGVDVLTLSATPIPRTLQMALTGMRDTSQLATPPPGRVAVNTTLAPQGTKDYAALITAEIARGGQSFYVVPRISDMDRVLDALAVDVPEARVLSAHGRMTDCEDRLEMFAAPDSPFDVLVATSVVENGLDLPRVNTIVVDGAHRFGLAALYQLRGRVGRSSKQAQCLLLHPAASTLTSEATQRLLALKQLSHVGAGFELARRDLELRGAGAVLGTRQHGVASAVGFDLFVELLQEETRRLQASRLEAAPNRTVVTLGGAAQVRRLGFPSSYFGDRDRAGVALGQQGEALWNADDEARGQGVADAARAALEAAGTRKALVALATEWTAAHGKMRSATKAVVKLRHLEIAAQRLGVVSIGYLRRARGATVAERSAMIAAPNMNFDAWDALSAAALNPMQRRQMVHVEIPANGVACDRLAELPNSKQVDWLLAALLPLVDVVESRSSLLDSKESLFTMEKVLAIDGGQLAGAGGLKVNETTTLGPDAWAGLDSLDGVDAPLPPVGSGALGAGPL